MSDSLLCSHQTQVLGESAAGTAGHHPHVILVELPLPWPSSIEDHPLLRGAGAAGASVFAISQGATAEKCRVISYRHSGDQEIGRFARAERVVQAADIAAAVSDTDTWLHTPVLDGDDVDVLICSHGSRDRCCGSFGTRLHVELLAKGLANTRVWRSSHLGGHRFAPTAITFPLGLSWAYLSVEDLTGIIERSVDPKLVAPKLRGSLAASSKGIQAADAAGFDEVGWGWLDSARTVVETWSADGHFVYLDGSDGKQAIGLQLAVNELPPVPVPLCGLPLEDATKFFDPVAIDVVHTAAS